MKGLLTKDFYMTLKYCKFLFLMDIVFIVIAIFMKNTMFMMMPILFSGIIPITLLSMDERSGWTVYSGTLPYSKAQIVSSKYLTGLLLVISTAAVVLGIMIILNAGTGGEKLAGIIAEVGLLLISSLFIPALCLPFCFRFGTEKGRIVNFVLTFLVTLGVASIADADTNSFDIKGLAPIIPAAIVVLYAASWVISIALYKRKAAA